ncbi:MAG: CDP-diacylglycerol--glycerol-3-phosphate 3-phosphatidyltransferase [Nitrospirota bacterium]|nr:MAG: CDP-diacylglycerol--glycerol-3-phosphate 3-phosphatidyltransferase [Nitrospirota bacterium]
MGIPKLNLPTSLTLSRIVIIPFFIIIMPGHPILATIIFLLAAVTDFLDGYLARLYGQVTTFGTILDPIADKFLVISALILLVDIGTLSAWIAIIIIVREFFVTALRVVALARNIVIKAEIGGKIKTATQITAIIFLMLKDSLAFVDLYDTGMLLIIISMLLAVISAVQYTINFWREV